jgi:putative transposase
MGVRRQLSDNQWERIDAFLEADYTVGEPGQDDRNFIEAVLWWSRAGAPWRDLPEEFGPWKTVFNRFDRWSKNGKWDRMFHALRADVDAEWHSLDSTANRAHQHSAGGKGGRKPMRSASREVAARPRFTSSSTLLACLSPSK